MVSKGDVPKVGASLLVTSPTVGDSLLVSSPTVGLCVGSPLFVASPTVGLNEGLCVASSSFLAAFDDFLLCFWSSSTGAEVGCRLPGVGLKVWEPSLRLTSSTGALVGCKLPKERNKQSEHHFVDGLACVDRI